MVGRWHPNYIVRPIDSRQSSTNVVIVETDIGPGYIKAIGNPAGTHCLASELVGTQLAELIGLQTLNYGLIHVDDSIDDIRFYCGTKAKSGPAFIAESEPGDVWDGSQKQLRQLMNPEDISRLVVFDTWTLNRDRKSQKMAMTDNVFMSTTNTEKGKLRLVAIDHTHCFVDQDGIQLDLTQIKTPVDFAVYGLFPEFRDFLDRPTVRIVADRLGRLDNVTVEGIVASIPSEWGVRASTRKLMVKFLLQRAAQTANEIEDRLFGPKHQQNHLEFGDSGNEP
ncbi:MAG: hypothetical protein JWP89_3164 [Schlesneria sp.]|nr:hypothetical protein [Schlesneria sp.]